MISSSTLSSLFSSWLKYSQATFLKTWLDTQTASNPKLPTDYRQPKSLFHIFVENGKHFFSGFFDE